MLRLSLKIKLTFPTATNNIISEVNLSLTFHLVFAIHMGPRKKLNYFVPIFLSIHPYLNANHGNQARGRAPRSDRKRNLSGHIVQT